jgi:hypothetical protein
VEIGVRIPDPQQTIDLERALRRRGLFSFDRSFPLTKKDSRDRVLFGIYEDHELIRSRQQSIHGVRVELNGLSTTQFNLM